MFVAKSNHVILDRALVTGKQKAAGVSIYNWPLPKNKDLATKCFYFVAKYSNLAAEY